MSGTPNAYQPCLNCGRGDVTTGFVIEGGRGYVQGGLVELAGIAVEDAADYVAERDEPIALRVRLCRPCARRTPVVVATLGTSKVPHYTQREEAAE